MRGMRRLALVLAVSSCATLDTSGMSESCRNLYNGCLDRCADANARSPSQRLQRAQPPAASGATAAAVDAAESQYDRQSFQTEVAACTRECNRNACR
jgi:hypothetical protein